MPIRNFSDEEARQRDFAWVRVRSRRGRAQQYGHRAAIVLVTGGRHTGKSFLARTIEARLVADGRHAYLLDGGNLRRGLDAASEGDRVRATRWLAAMVRVARFCRYPGVVVSRPILSVWPTSKRQQAIRDACPPGPVIAIHLSKMPEEVPTQLRISCVRPTDFDAATRQILEERKRVGCWLRRSGPTDLSVFNLIGC